MEFIRATELDANRKFQIQECLAGLGISSSVELDVLIFVYRHQASLANADQLARLLGYPCKAIGDALEKLEARKLIQRSSGSRGAHLYELISVADLQLDCVRQLVTLAEDREGRLLIAKNYGNAEEDHDG